VRSDPSADKGSRQADRRRNVTLRDVARVASVDPSVVSRVINDDPVLTIGAETRARVQAAIASTGYRTNLAARNLRMSRNLMLGLVLPDVTNPVYSPIVRGVTNAASKAGYAVVLGSDLGSQPSVDSFARLLDDGRVDGLLVASGTVDDETVRSLIATSDRVVLVNRSLLGMGASVVVDDAAGAQLAVEHLIALGHLAIGHIAGPSKVETSARRASGFAAALRGAGIPVRKNFTVEMDDWTATAGYAAATRLLSLEPRPTALFVANVTAAIGAMRAAADLGMSVPRDVSVVGLHDTEFANFFVPRLTTVAMPLERLGEVAGGVLIDMLNGKPAVGHVVVDDPLRLVIRESTGPPGRHPA
jgi:LacI family transcriptional regulator